MDEKKKNIIIILITVGITILVGLVIVGVQVDKWRNAQKEIIEQLKDEAQAQRQAQAIKEAIDGQERKEILGELRREMNQARDKASQELLTQQIMEAERKQSALARKMLGIEESPLEHPSENENINIRVKDALERKKAAEEAYLRYLTNQDESQAKE
jgi:FtsZ-interacting cell division protein ZipA